MKNRLLIIGASGHGKVVADIAKKMNRWRNIAFLDDDQTIKSCAGLEVIGTTSNAHTFVNETDFFVAIGNNCIREKVLLKLNDISVSIVSLTHPSAIIGADVEIGMGTVIMAGVVINSSTKIGKGCIINTCCSIDHDNLIKDYVHISPGVRTAGNVKIGIGSWLGIGSVVINNVNICSGCIIGAGGVVVKDINESGTYAGVPVRRLSK